MGERYENILMFRIRGSVFFHSEWGSHLPSGWENCEFFVEFEESRSFFFVGKSHITLYDNPNIVLKIHVSECLYDFSPFFKKNIVPHLMAYGRRRGLRFLRP